MWDVTLGVLYAKQFNQEKFREDLPDDNSVFIVHGHDEGTKQAVTHFLEQIGIKPVILQEQRSGGLTLIEKFEEFAPRAGFAVILMTADDIGHPVGRESEKRSRARQNVILELGYFIGKLGRGKTCVLYSAGIEVPSDFMGIVYTPIDGSEGWKMTLAKELKAAKFKIDANKLIQ